MISGRVIAKFVSSHEYNLLTCLLHSLSRPTSFDCVCNRLVAAALDELDFFILRLNYYFTDVSFFSAIRRH